MQIEKYKKVIDGLEVTYYKLGSGKPLLFLHGGRVRAMTFKRNLKLLAENYTVYAPDIPGYGSSATPNEIWSFEDYGKFFVKFIEDLNLSHVTVFGYSMGGGIAFNLAAYSSRIERLVLADASGIPVMKSNQQSSYDLLRLKFYLTKPQYVRSLLVLARDYLQFMLKHRHDSAHITAIRAKCLDTSYDTFSRISVPTLILWGERDWIYPPIIARQFMDKMPHSKLVFVKGNHDWVVYDPLLLKQSMI